MSMQIFVQQTETQQLAIRRVQVSDTIESLLDPTRDAYLTFGAKPLRPECTVGDYAIQNGSTLQSIQRERGGCFIISISLWCIILICAVLSLCTCGLSCSVVFILLPFACLLPFCCL